MKSKILVTGGAGYIGSVLVQQLLQQGYAVRVIDNLRWGGESVLAFLNNPLFEFFKGDVRNSQDIEIALRNVDAIVHLAAIVGDPACGEEPQLAQETNYDASVKLYQSAQKAGVKRFLFASTCSNYGKMYDPDQWCTEESELKPLSLYAKLKVKFEKYLFSQTGEPCTTALRFSTAYGISPRMRFDLTVNEFTREVVLGKELLVFGEQFWRPYCHTVDLSRACISVLEAPTELVSGQAVNVGDDSQNYQKKMLVDELKKNVPDMKVRFIHKEEDPRDYRVRFDKIKRLGFKISKRVPDGVEEIASALRSRLLSVFDHEHCSNTPPKRIKEAS